MKLDQSGLKIDQLILLNFCSYAYFLKSDLPNFVGSEGKVIMGKLMKK